MSVTRGDRRDGGGVTGKNVASGRGSRLCFNIYKRETTGSFKADLRTISSHVCGHKTRYFKAKNDCSLSITKWFLWEK